MSTTPTPRNPGGTVPASPSISQQEEVAHPSQDGKRKMLQPYSDEETGETEDFQMGGGRSPTQQHGRQDGVKFVLFANFQEADFPLEPASHRGRHLTVVPVVPYARP